MCGLPSLCTGLSGEGDFFEQKTHFTGMSRYLQDAVGLTDKTHLSPLVEISRPDPEKGEEPMEFPDSNCIVVAEK